MWSLMFTKSIWIWNYEEIIFEFWFFLPGKFWESFMFFHFWQFWSKIISENECFREFSESFGNNIPGLVCSPWWECTFVVFPPGECIFHPSRAELGLSCLFMLLCARLIVFSYECTWDGGSCLMRTRTWGFSRQITKTKPRACSNPAPFWNRTAPFLLKNDGWAVEVGFVSSRVREGGRVGIERKEGGPALAPPPPKYNKSGGVFRTFCGGFLLTKGGERPPPGRNPWWLPFSGRIIGVMRNSYSGRFFPTTPSVPAIFPVPPPTTFPLFQQVARRYLPLREAKLDILNNTFGHVPSRPLERPLGLNVNWKMPGLGLHASAYSPLLILASLGEPLLYFCALDGNPLSYRKPTHCTLHNSA